VTVSIETPRTLAGYSIALGYLDVIIAGSGESADRSVRFLHSTDLSAAGDDDDQLFVSAIRLDGITSGPIFAVRVLTCGAPPTASSFGCVVRSAADADAADVQGVTCSVAVE
jgi:hypothetical protein